MIAALVFSMSTATTFMQLGFVGVELPDGHVSYAVLQLLPVVLGSLCLGVPTGTLNGAVSGAIMYIHSIIMPLDFHELALITPLSSIVLLALCGFLAAVLFYISLNKGRTLLWRSVFLCISCIIISWLFSIGFSANAILAIQSGESARLTAAEFAAVFYNDSVPVAERLYETVLQAWVDAFLMSACCVGVNVLAEHLLRLKDDVGLRMAFNLTIALVVFLAYLITATLSFGSATRSERRRAEASVRSEVNYLCLQLQGLGKRADSFNRLAAKAGINEEDLTEQERADYRLLSDPVGDLIEGYTMEETGTVAIILDGKILATDDVRLPVGSDVEELLGSDVSEAIAACLKTGELQRIPYDGVLAQTNDPHAKVGGMQMAYLLSGQEGDYTVMIIEPSTMFFKNRPGIMNRELTLAVVLLSVVFLVVTFLLNITVAQRIDETNEALKRITDGDLNARVSVGGTHEFKMLSSGINVTVDALNSWIAEAENRMNAELEAARAIQESALPTTFPPYPDLDAFDVYATMDAAREVGGDFYDFFLIDGHTLGFLIADVSGKGVPASLFMMEAKSELSNHMKTGMKLSQAVSSANWNLCQGNESYTFVTVWAATLDFSTGKLTYVNAGHNPPLLRHDGAWQWLKLRGGPFLGVSEKATFHQETLVLQANDQLLLYTDGVNEAFNTNWEEYGDVRLENFLKAHPTLTPRELAHALRVDVRAWAGDAEQSDDITILSIEYGAPPR